MPGMTAAKQVLTKQILALNRWLAEAVLGGATEMALVEGTCTRLQEVGLPLRRVMVGVDTLHPVVSGRSFYWRRDQAAEHLEFGRADARVTANWEGSPHHYLLSRGESRLRRRLDRPETRLDEFPILGDLVGQGVTDYVAYLNRLAADAAIGEMDCIYSSWTTDRSDGFTDDELAALDHLAPVLSAAIKNVSLGRIAETLVETYLGRDAGRRVLRGAIDRGVAERIPAVLWFSDLKGFTRLVDTLPPDQVIPLLNDYADALVTSIHGAGGQVLKFVGDGILAVFDARQPADGCRAALAAVADAIGRVAAVNNERGADGRPVTGFYIALHVGEVFYGNIGSVDRLDFTVIGPAVNEVTRIAGMCRSLDQDIILSPDFARASGAGPELLVSLGRYALRGVARPQELYTVDRAAWLPGIGT